MAWSVLGMVFSSLKILSIISKADWFCSIKACPPEHMFLARISPQLLLYRLTIFLGIPPQVFEWEEPTRWYTSLEYTNDGRSPTAAEVIIEG